MASNLKGKVQKILAGGSLFPCSLFYVVGLIWFCLLSQDELNNETYMSENALLVGQVAERFDDHESTMKFYKKATQFSNNQDMTEFRSWLTQELSNMGLEVYTQNFTFSHAVLYPQTEVEGSNLYAIMRSPSGGRTEAILLTVPLRTLSISSYPPVLGSLAVVLSLLKTLRQQIYWSKDIVLVFPEFEYAGLLAWVEAYHGGERSTYLSWSELEGRSGNIQAGLNLEFTSPDVSSLDIFPEGVNGLLANLDLVNTVVRLAHKHSIQAVVNGQPFLYPRGDLDVRVQDAQGLMRAVWTQAPGSPTGLHGLLINYQIPAVTLRSPSPYLHHYDQQHPTARTGKFLEGILRSLNNLQERMHQSFWYYLLPNPLRYISIGVYMPPVLVLIGSLLVKVIGFWIPLADASTAVPPESTVKPRAHDEQTKTVTREEVDGSSDQEQTVRKRHVTKKPEETTSTASQQHKTKPQTKSVAKTDADRISSAIFEIALWTVAAFSTGLGLLVSPKLIFAARHDERGQAALRVLGVEPTNLATSELLACAVAALFLVAVIFVPPLTALLRRLFNCRSGANRLWKRSIILVTWALFLACLTCLNVSASLMLSLPIVPLLLIFVHPRTRSKLSSMLFGLFWLPVSPLGLMVIGCVLYLSIFDETLLYKTQPIHLTGLWSCFTRAFMQPLMEADLFGCWTWPAMTCGFTSLWMLTWLDVVGSC